MRFVLIPLFFPVLVCAAQPSLTQHIHSAMERLGMSDSDIYLPYDWVKADPHRTRFHDSLFTHPLGSISVARRLSSEAVSMLTHADPVLFSDLIRLTEVGYSPLHLFGAPPSQLPVAITDLHGRPTEITDNGTHIIVQSLLNRIITAKAAAADARKRVRNTPMVERWSDSLWLESGSNEKASLFDTYRAEREQFKEVSDYFNLAQPAWFENVYRSGAELYLQAITHIGNIQATPGSIGSDTAVHVYQTPAGLVAIGTTGSDVYHGTYALIFDPGGDDIYTIGPSSKADALNNPVQCIIDLGGNDTYNGNDMALGCGYFGVGILIDVAGNDTYRSANFSQGCGLFGFGILHDIAGNDFYIGGQNTQGTGIFGIGILADNAGSDMYHAHSQAQGFGGTRGAGMLVDLAGNDQYVASSPVVDVLRYNDHFTTFAQGAALGNRPHASGGIGILYDATGNDTYVCDIFGQGVGYWFGLGALLDDAGHDKYLAHQYAQGSGVHFATGILVDSAGNDVYSSHGVSQGCGHDVALGLLCDVSGNDSYAVESLSLGGGNANAISIFTDLDGSDLYAARDSTNTLGFSDFRRSMGMIGIFYDANGTDFYSSTQRNNSTSLQSTYGTFIDDSDSSVRQPVTKQSTPSPEEPPLPLATSFDSLFIQASAAPLKYQSNVKPARDSLVALGTGILDSLWQYLGTQMPRERLTIEYVVPKLYSADSTAVIAFLHKAMQSDDRGKIGAGCVLAGLCKSISFVEPLITVTGNTSWGLRSAATLSLSQIGSPSALSAVTKLLSDKHPYVRARAGYAIGTLTKGELPLLLVKCFMDKEQIVRNSAVEGTVRGEKRTIADIIPIWQKCKSHNQRISCARLLGCVDPTPENVASFTKWMKGASAEWKKVMTLTLPSQKPEWLGIESHD
ncbi:MAG: HEAT repeat domain-containing protein [Chlorobi bacterium]|nr:MAG: HEAT repeat domain-containing protein [Bacteroidota bacterium]MBL1161704.1 HEAT repeat domain-containing protein [Chlorobiota bacterium]MBZ0193609.1 HEAT repeat domain-containing protein [Candidatus Kapabacteria bacterium]MCC6331812.1 HEAT repeat domain-containing protein [Ignavibacteria bacterium]MBV6463957.1 hypothetical protein [Chlorobiota bacterium]